MLATETILFVALCYIGALFAVAYFGDNRARIGRSIINSPSVYALSLAVYCTAWTFYGSVGRAVRSGPAFLAIYIGPTLASVLGWLVLRKIIRISRVNRITSIADFIASRYGKSILLGGVVTVIAVLGIVPYISLQLKAVSSSFLIMKNHTLSYQAVLPHEVDFFHDTALYVAIILAAFAVLFGTRRPDATERHEGLVAAIALESLVKLIAFLAVGLFVTFGLFDGFTDLFAHARGRPELVSIFSLEPYEGSYSDWFIATLLSMLAFWLLPRQFHLAVVENVRENHLRQALWLFPLYLLAINIFVLPVACAGMLQFGGSSVDADSFVLLLPLAQHQKMLTLLVFIGGMSAATGMIIVETIALSTMICNNLVMPVLLFIPGFRRHKRIDLGKWLVAIRHGGIVTTIFLGYIYLHLTSGFYTLVSIGMISFAAVAQFAPALLGGIFWKGGTKSGALWGLVAGFIVWCYTLPLASLAEAGLLSSTFLTQGPGGLGWLKPYALFGLSDFDRISHAVFWSLLFNTTLYVGVSLFSRPSALERAQAIMFVDVFHLSREADAPFAWRGTALVPDLISLVERFLGKERSEEALHQYYKAHPTRRLRSPNADPGLVAHVEKLLAGAIGSASARVVVASVVQEEPLSIPEVMDILDETRQVIVYSHELERATAELKAANERLQELDRLKDEFISTVSHELRTPLTSIQSLAEILRDYPETEPEEQRNFLNIMINEIQRLSRLINQVLDFQKIESGKMVWQLGPVDIPRLLEDAVASTRQLAVHKKIEVNLETVEAPVIIGDRDQLMQAMVNLIANAIKFCDAPSGRIDIRLVCQQAHIELRVQDNGIGIRPEDRGIIFEQFRQIVHPSRGRPAGSGLGLAITKRIIDYHGGRIRVESETGRGAAFIISLPMVPELTSSAFGGEETT